MGKLRVFAQNFTFYTIFFTFHRDHINAYIRWDPTHCTMCIVVHLYCHKYTTEKSYMVINEINYEFSLKISPFILYFSQFIATIWTAINGWEPIHCNLSIHVQWYCHKFTTMKSYLVINGKITSFRPKFHLSNYIFHISPGPRNRNYTLRPYTLPHVYTCPLVLSQIYNIEKLYGNRWVYYKFSPKISHFTLYFSHFTGTT